MSDIEHVARLVKLAREMSVKLGKIVYVYVSGDGVWRVEARRPGNLWLARVYPGGRTEARGFFAELIKEWEAQP